MKILSFLFYVALVTLLQANMAPVDIQKDLSRCPAFDSMEDSEAPALLKHMLEVAKYDSPTIRQALVKYDDDVFSQDEGKGARKWFFNQKVLFALLFQFERGPVKSMPFSRVGFIRIDREMDKDEVIEYSLPIEVGADGVVKIGYRYGGYEGRGPWKGEAIEVFDILCAKYKRRVIDFSKQPNQSLEPTGLASTPRADARVAPAKPVAHH